MKQSEILNAIDYGISLWWRTIGKARGFKHHTGDIEWVMSEDRTGPERIFNVRLSPETATKRIDEIEAGMKAGALPCGMLLTPLSTPENIVELLAGHGFQIDDSSPCMALGFDGFHGVPANPQINVSRVAGRDTLQAWAVVANTGLFGRELFSLQQYGDMYRLDNTCLYLAHYDGIPASACMTIHDGEIATVECVATLPEFRRRGLASAAVSYALEALKGCGVKIVTLRSEPDGVCLYQKLGFIELCKRVVASIS